MRPFAHPHRSAPLALSLLASIALAGGLSTLGGCVQAPVPYDSVLSSRMPLPPAQPLSPEEQRRYAEIDRQVLRDQEYRHAIEQAPRVAYPSYPYYSYYPAPVSVYGGFYSGRGSRWGSGVSVGSGFWW